MLDKLFNWRFWPLFFKELNEIRRNRRLVGMMLVPPTLNLVLLGFAMNPEVTDMRLGIVDENGEGEKVGGIVIMRYGENAKDVIDRVKLKLEDVTKGLPEGVRIKAAYDRSDLIEATVKTLREAVTEEIIVVAIVLFIFLFHVRSALIVVLTIPISVLFAFILMSWFGITSNIMSLAGVALAVGDLVDAGIVMVENAMKSISGEAETT